MNYHVKKSVFTVSLINARSLKNKLDSLKITLDELGTDVCILTETWFKTSDNSIKQTLQDFKDINDYEFLRKDRESGKRGGGIAICFRSSRIQMSKAKIPPSKHEVFAAVGRRVGQRRKVVVLAIYIPPWYNADQNRSLFKYTNDAIMALKIKYEDPYFMVAGDFNRRDFRLATNEYPDIKSITTGPTRGDAVLDVIGSNMNDTIIDCGTVEPITSGDGVPTDHRTVFSQFRVPRVPDYTIESYSYLHLNEEGHEKFGRWISGRDWTDLLGETDANEAVEKLHQAFDIGLAASYTKITRKKKSSEPAWMTDWIRKDIASRRRIFKTDEGRSPRWRAFKEKITRQVKKRKKKNNDYILSKFDGETNPGKFFHHLQCLLGHNEAKRWSPMQLYPGESKSLQHSSMILALNMIS